MDFLYFLVPIFEILIIWTVFNYLVELLWGTRAMDVVLGFLSFLFLFFLATKFDLPVIRKLMLYIVNIAAIAVFIIFQPEIRLALSKVRFKSRKYMIQDHEKFIDNLALCVYHMSEKQIGALIVLENKHLLEEYSTSAVFIDANFSPELLEAIFQPTSPLHDGAVIIHGTTVSYAGVILPLSQDASQLSKTMGTRHRAALGASQKSDVVVIVVSEENGKVSVSRDGILTRGIKIDRFKAILKSVFVSETTNSKSFRSWFYST
ncbi:MAG: diadenylate cyclase CdaA [Victivallaceae bacterium]